MKTSYEDQYFLLRKALGTTEFGHEAAVADIIKLKSDLAYRTSIVKELRLTLAAVRADRNTTEADLATANNDLMAIACMSNDVRLTDHNRLSAIVRILMEVK